MLTKSQGRDHCRLTICWLVEFDNLMTDIFAREAMVASLLVSVVMVVMVVMVKVGKAPGKYLQ